MIDLPHWDALSGDARRSVKDIDNWARVLRDSTIVATFSATAAEAMDGLEGAALLDALNEFASEHWDYRGGRERNLAESPSLTPQQVAAIDFAAATLGLDGTPPPRRSYYDAVVMTGGMVRAGIVKPRYLRELADSGLEWGEGVFLGGFRPFAGDEFDIARALNVPGDNEFDAMTAGIRLAFELGPPDAIQPPDFPASSTGSPGEWREDFWVWNGRELRVVAAPSSDASSRRANTADTFRFWASRAGGIHSVLVITTPVYVPYQGAVAVEILGLEFGLSVETVAVSASASDLGRNSQLFLPHHRAQELRSGIQGLRSLRARVSELP